jgi:hypothetical protein
MPLRASGLPKMTRRTNNPVWRLLGRLPFIDWYVARRERAYAESQCRSLLEIYEHLRREHPELGSDRLYARVVEYRIGCDPTVARSIVLEADRSFAQWPTERDVTFRDVVVFLLLNQLLPADSKTLGVQPNVTAIVAKAIPLRL